MSKVPSITLNNGVSMPQLGFGVWQVPDDEAAKAVGTALEAGYRSIDTAAIYDNEEGTGQAVAASGIPREELFLTTKLWNTEQGYDSTLRAFDASLARLGLDYVDLYLIHWPLPAKDAFVDTYKAFESILADGRAKAIGVSNFLPAHLERLFGETSVVPAVEPDRAPPAAPAGRVAGVPRQARHRHRGVVPARPGPRAAGGPDDRRDRAEAREDPGAGGAPLASAAGQRRDPQVRDPVPDPGEHRRLRLRAGRRRSGGVRRPGRGPAPRTGPGDVLAGRLTLAAAAEALSGRLPWGLT